MTQRGTAVTSRISPRGALLLLGLVALVIALVHAGRLSRDSLIGFAVLIPSIILHEVAHGAMASRLGDNTARRAGRLTLNPASHVDLVGTLLVPAMSILAGWGFIGWAKPVPVDPRQLRHPRNASVAVALAGPATNLVLVAVGYAGFRATFDPQALSVGIVPLCFYYLGLTNLWLAVLNLLPIPPLDGSAVLERLLPARLWPEYLKIRHLFFPVLIGIVLVSAVLNLGLLNGLSGWLSDRWNSLLGVA